MKSGWEKNLHEWNELTKTVTHVFLDTNKSGRQKLLDSLEGTVVWDNDWIGCPQMVLQLYNGFEGLHESNHADQQ